MNAHTVFLICWIVGMVAAVALAYNGNVLLAFFVLVICASLRSTKS